MISDDPQIPVFVPPLLTVLSHHEVQKGSPLTEEEVFAIRDHSVLMLMRKSVADRLVHERGYHDLDPSNCWQEWQSARIMPGEWKCRQA